MVLGSLVHILPQLLNIVLKQSLLNQFQVAQSRIIRSQQLLEFVNISHVVFLLKSDVLDSLRHITADSVKELGFSYQNLELWREVDLVVTSQSSIFSLALALLLLDLDQDVPLEQINGILGVVGLPPLENLVLVVLVELFGQVDVLDGHFLELIRSKLFSLGLELLNRS